MTPSSPRLQHLPADVCGLTQLERDVLRGAAPRTIEAPRSLTAWRPPARTEDSTRGDELGSVLEAELTKFEPPVAVLDAVRLLGEPSLRLVAASVRPGLLGGPLGNLWAGLHAIALARALEARWSRPVRALLWIEEDDVSYEASRSVRLLDDDFDRPRLALRADHDAADSALGELPLNGSRHGLESFEAQLRAHLLPGKVSELLIERFAPREGETLAAATARALLHLLGPQGLLVLEPRWVREPVSRLLAQRLGSLPGAWPGPLATPLARAPWVYRFEGAVARPLFPGGDGFRYRDEPGSRRPTELAAELVQEPGRWGVGPALRCDLAHDLLPLAAWIAGADELEVIASKRPWPRDRPTIVMPLRATLFGPGEGRALARLGWSAAEALSQQLPGEPRSGEAGTAVDAAAGKDVTAKLWSEARRARKELLGLRAELAELDPGLAARLRQLAARVEGLIGDLASRAERVAGNREGKGRRHLRRLANTLLPGGRPQAEGHPLLLPLARFGSAWIEGLLEDLDPLPTEHLAIFLDD